MKSFYKRQYHVKSIKVSLRKLLTTSLQSSKSMHDLKQIRQNKCISVLRAFPFNMTQINLWKCSLPWVTAPSSLGRDLTKKKKEKKKEKRRGIGSYWLNTLWYIHQYSWNHASKATDSLAVLFLVRQIVPLLLNSSVNAVRGGDKKWSDPHMEGFEVISITLPFISAGWLKMIRVPELKLILRDWLSVRRGVT